MPRVFRFHALIDAVFISQFFADLLSYQSVCPNVKRYTKGYVGQERR